MKILHKTFPINTSYPLEKLGDPKKLLFFDIETTGLSPYTSSLYLIGCVSVVEESFLLTQLFIESMEDEQHILKQFSRIVEDKELLIQYNGDTFDVPYLTHCYEQYHLPSPFEGKKQLDLLKNVRKLKKLLNLPNCKLKTAESFLGIERQDPYTGGELIEQYLMYQKTKDPDLFRNLILHNEEDLEFLPPILDFLWYEELSHATCTLMDKSFSANLATFTYRLSFKLPAPIVCDGRMGTFSIMDDQLLVKLPIFRGELRHYYPDYKDYYYLPNEDIVIHKRIAEFMHTGNRKKANAQNCFVKKCGAFLPQSKEAITPSFKEDYRSKCFYFEITNERTDRDWCCLGEDLLHDLF